ncbi:hypothetical protein FisN_31Lh084 [Fistulifera solaris]|uniref:Glycosyl transferase CAP10 domain-containing protein n=1 Tax=Fistulifera solaris TaxID=1519565 RepID=A0A1Z5K680_FISSO|nr:hypothetical protein FisN_31Lh084 [Fistulifera solaris]|eukprot:GAX21793.1 hypothetical protein FisN_31Lh084 [Fistulifera solaris]
MSHDFSLFFPTTSSSIHFLALEAFIHLYVRFCFFLCMSFLRKGLILGIVFALVLRIPFLFVSRDFSRTTNDDLTSSDSTSSSLLNHHPYFFPRWGIEGIVFDDWMSFVQGLGNGTASTVLSPKTRNRFPEIVYVVDAYGVYVSSTLVQRSTLQRTFQHRQTPTEQLFTVAWQLLKETNSTRWRLLQEAKEGFPFLTWYADCKSCHYHNWNNTYSIPLLTTCAPVLCQYAFPIPNYQNVLSAQSNWEQLQASYRTHYSSQQRQLLWRGSLSAPNEHFNSTRWRVVVHAQNDPRVDAGFVSIGHINAGFQWQNLGAGMLRPAVTPMSDFQRYFAILDMDGNAWSSRFGELLCYNSIVVKVEPAYVESINRDLIPWKHYIPMASNLSDWDSVLDFLFDSRNDAKIQRIIQNANHWCRQQLTMPALAARLLDVWENYLWHMEKGSPQWQAKWSEYKASIFNSDLNMVKLN